MGEVKKKYKCFTFFIKDTDVVKNKILDIMTDNSRLFYNRTMYCYNIYKFYEFDILEYVYDKVIRNDKLLKSLKLRKKTTPNQTINNYLYEIYNEKYKFYSDNYNLFKKIVLSCMTSLKKI